MTNSTSNVYLDGSGHLVLKALHSGTDPNSGWTSGRVETQADGFGALPGGVVRVQASIQQPDLTTANGAGYWPAFWMLGSPLRIGVPWPGSGEVDAMEDINARSSEFGTLHCGTDPGGPCNEGTGIGSGERACGGCQTGYHTYAVELDRSTSPEQIRWYLDGTNFFTVNSTQVDATTWANAVDHSFYIIFDLAIGGAFPAAFGGGPNAATASGGSLNVDYVAVYNKAPAANANLGPDIALGKPTTASSEESASFPAANATDGDITSRWSSGFSDPQWLQVDLGQTYAINHATLVWEAATASAYQIQTSTDGTNWTTIYTNNNSPQDIQDMALSGTGRYIRVYATARASQWGDSLYEFDVYGSPTSGGGGTPTLLSQGRSATASSQESASFPAANAVDGNLGTRWSSQFSDPQWLEVDLGATHTISQVVLNWETAYATALPDPDLERRHQLDHDLLDDHRNRWCPDLARVRVRTLCADVRHNQSHPMGLFALGVPSIRLLTSRNGAVPGTFPTPRRRFSGISTYFVSERHRTKLGRVQPEYADGSLRRGRRRRSRRISAP